MLVGVEVKVEESDLKFRSAWDFVDFVREVNADYRFVHSLETAAFLKTLAATAVNRSCLLPKGFEFWRAQRGYLESEKHLEDEDLVMSVPVPFENERMKPRKGSAHEGRANPAGIPCLYGATNKETAMSETRPWTGAKISAGRFLTVRGLKIVDLSIGQENDYDPELIFKKLTSKEIENLIWAQVGRAFSWPSTRDLSNADYAPTQIITEAIRRKNFDGIMYKSTLGSGKSMALFDLDSAEVVERTLYETSAVKFEFTQLKYL